MDTLLQDLRYAVRTLARTPTFTLAAVATLALGIGATTAIFTVLDRALIRRLPVEDPGRLVHVVTERDGGTNYNLSYPAFADLLTERAFAGVAAHSAAILTLAVGDGVERVEGAAVSHGFFAALGVRLLAGREFTADEDRPGAAQDVVVLSHALWRRRFPGDPATVGATIRLNDRPFTVVGITAPAYTGLMRGAVEEAWIPLSLAGAFYAPDFAERRGMSWLNVLARLAPGTSRAQATAALDVLDAQRRQDGRLPRTSRTRLLGGERGLLASVADLERPLNVLMAAVTLVLAIACANVAGLLLARASGRRREIAVRQSLGAGRSRLVRQLMTEGFVLAAAGSGAGLMVALWLGEALPIVRTGFGDPLAIPRGFDGRMLAFAALASVVTALAFGLLPALATTRPDVTRDLRDGGGLTARPGRRVGARDALVVAQVALSVLVLAGAGVLVRSVLQLRAVPAGFDAGGVVLASFDLRSRGYDAEARRALYARTAEQLAALPGVDVASFASTITPNPGGSNWDGIRLEGSTANPDDVSFDVNQVGPSYFEALRIPVVAGRGILPTDRPGAPPVVVVNQAMARRYWPGQNPVGRRLWVGTDTTTPAVEIVGVVPDGKYRSLREEPSPMAYFPALRGAPWQATLIVRGAGGDPGALAAAIRRAMREVDPQLPLFNLRTLEDHVAVAYSRETLVAALATGLGVVALALSAVGLFGLLSYAVARRTREIGVRVALGARRADVLRLVIGQGIARAALGVAIGVPAALVAVRFVRSLLFGVGPADPLAFATATAVLGVVALAACLGPAHRAARIAPMEALRHE